MAPTKPKGRPEGNQLQQFVNQLIKLLKKDITYKAVITLFIYTTTEMTLKLCSLLLPSFLIKINNKIIQVQIQFVFLP